MITLLALYIIPMLILLITAYKVAKQYPPDSPFYGNHLIVVLIVFAIFPVVNFLLSVLVIIHYVINKIRK